MATYNSQVIQIPTESALWDFSVWLLDRLCLKEALTCLSKILPEHAVFNIVWYPVTQAGTRADFPCGYKPEEGGPVDPNMNHSGSTWNILHSLSIPLVTAFGIPIKDQWFCHMFWKTSTVTSTPQRREILHLDSKIRVNAWNRECLIPDYKSRGSGRLPVWLCARGKWSHTACYESQIYFGFHCQRERQVGFQFFHSGKSPCALIELNNFRKL